MAASILLVDDNENFLSFLERVFSKRGYHVKTASNGEEALKLIDEGSFAVAILDIRMGPVDGISLLMEIKRREPFLKSIIITGYPTPETRFRAFQNGASAYLTKPVDLEELVDTTRSLMAN
ncbi:MAG: response regulator [Deltaproteobacteria bacterium]|nr:response regulator [Deltaproteobacteria bacterium]